MKLSVLVENNVPQSTNLLGEHGLSFYVEDCGKKILFDTGYSDAFIKNAQKLGINLLNLDYIILSHGHYDHTWGLSHYFSLYNFALKQGEDVKKPTIVTHPDTFLEKTEEDVGEIGCMISKEKLEKNFDLILAKEPFKITKNLTFLGEIPRQNDFEGKEFIGKVCKNGEFIDDYILEDSAIVYDSEDGLVIITGCSHSGICNIVEYAKSVTSKSKVFDIIGGFHLVNSSKERLSKTVGYLGNKKISRFHPCHCVDFRSKLFLSKYLKIEPIGVGFRAEYKGN